jgi:homoserine O-acetyltransferase
MQLDEVLVIGVTTDVLFPVQQQRDLATGFEGAGIETEYVELDCIRGHDSFLVDMDAFRPVICRFFETVC